MLFRAYIQLAKAYVCAKKKYRFDMKQGGGGDKKVVR